ncbi:HlyD family efflux transporter periplasmic adaptor subunit [Phycisphaerales bacterium ac7]
MQIEVDRLRRQRTSLEGEREALRQVLNAIPSRRAALQARIASQRAELALAEIDLARSVVRSPISGVIAEVFSDAGDLVSSGSPLARIVDLSTIEVPLQIPAAASRRVAVGASALVREPSGGGRSMRARSFVSLRRSTPLRVRSRSLSKLSSALSPVSSTPVVSTSFPVSSYPERSNPAQRRDRW